MIIGNFTHDRETNTYAGTITTLTLHREDVQLRPVEKNGDKGPAYRVYGTTASGSVEFGAAWKRVSDTGREFLSLELDDPAFTAPLYARLLTNENGSANLFWNRKPKKEQEASEPAAPKAATTRKKKVT